MSLLKRILGIDVIQSQNKEIIDLLKESNKIALHRANNDAKPPNLRRRYNG